MKNKIEYKTKQREIVYNFLKENKKNHVTAEIIVDELRNREIPVSLATVYRNLNKLVEEGVVLKYSNPEGLRACYQYTHDYDEYYIHYHLICDRCGGIAHITSNLLDQFSDYAIKKYNFKVNKFKTVLYGTCEKCLT